MSKAEEFIQNHTRNCGNEILIPLKDNKGYYTESYTPWLTPDQARKAVEIAREEIFEWLRKKHEEYQYKAPYNYFDIEQCIEDLKNCLKK